MFIHIRRMEMWLKLLFPMLALIAGMAVAVQGQINGGLGKKMV